MTFSKASTALLERSLSLDSRCHNLPAEVALDVAVVFHREFNSYPKSVHSLLWSWETLKERNWTYSKMISSLEPCLRCRECHPFASTQMSHFGAESFNNLRGWLEVVKYGLTPQQVISVCHNLCLCVTEIWRREVTVILKWWISVFVVVIISE